MTVASTAAPRGTLSLTADGAPGGHQPRTQLVPSGGPGRALPCLGMLAV